MAAKADAVIVNALPPPTQPQGSAATGTTLFGDASDSLSQSIAQRVGKS